MFHARAVPAVGGGVGGGGGGGGGGFTAGGDLTGSSSSQTVVNAHVPNGTVPALGSGADGLSPDGTSGTYRERQGNWVGLTASGGPQTVLALPASVPVGAVATIVAEVHVTIDGNPAFSAFGYFTQRSVLRNVSGTLTNTTGGQGGQSQATNNLGTAVTAAGVVCTIDATTNPPTIKVDPGSAACHARVAVVDYYFGTSGV